MHDRPKQIESARQESASQSEVPRQWQFSLRGLMFATAVVSVIMALGAYLVGAAFVIFVVVLVESASLLSFEWLIRPANRRFLAFTTAGCWAVLGSALLIIGVKVGCGIVMGSTDPEFWAAVIALSIFAVACYGFAWHRWRQLRPKQP